MKEPGHDDLVVVYYKIYGVGEPSEQTTSEFTMRFLIKEGMTGNIAGAGIKHPEKFIAKSGRFRFIPDIAADGIILDFREKTERVYHFLFRFSIEGHQGTGARRERLRAV